MLKLGGRMVAAGAGTAEHCDGKPVTATIGVGVENLEVGGVGPGDAHRALAAAAGLGSPVRASPRTREEPPPSAEPPGTSSRFFPFGGPNLRATGTLIGIALEVFLSCGINGAVEVDADG